MAVRNDFAAGEVLSAVDLNDTFADKATDAELTAGLASKLDLAGGKILQIVRATDGTDRSTTGNTTVDANLSVTITPEKNDSAVLLIWSVICDTQTGSTATTSFASRLSITDSSNNVISGAETFSGVTRERSVIKQTLIGYSTPATTSAVTYKARFQSDTNITATVLLNATEAGQLYAIEVSA